MKGKPENNQLMIFFLIAYGITFAMGFFMWYGAYHMDLNVFPNAQMMYPAAGVMLGFLLFRKKMPICRNGFSAFSAGHGGDDCNCRVIHPAAE